MEPNTDQITNAAAAGRPNPQGLFDPACERDSCGVGLIAQMDGTPRHSVVEDAVRILVNLEHRGALGGDNATGDGAGLLMNMPDEFLRHACQGQKIKLPAPGQYAVGMVFLPQQAKAAGRCRRMMEETAMTEGCEVLGWRPVPTLNRHLGEFSRSSQPDIAQCFLAPGKGMPWDAPAFERTLYVIRRLMEKEVASWSGGDYSQFYICSLSSRTLSYKGMLTGTQLAVFFPDLQAKEFKIAFSLAHQRYSTNTLPSWRLAQPFRYLAHNGEINTLRGNINRMRAREAVMHSGLFGDALEKIKPVLCEDGSDSAILDNALELLVAGGRSLPHAIMMMVPEAFGRKYHMSQDKRAFYEYHSSFMEPWDGPASLIFTDGRYIGGTLDRNGLRPSRYTVTYDGLVVLASETGVLDIPANNIRQYGRLQPGKMFLVDMQEKRIVPDREIKAAVSRQRPYRKWVQSNQIELRGLFAPAKLPETDAVLLRRRQHAFGYTDEEVKMIITPMAANGQEPVGSMGNDAALAVLSNRPQLLFNYFKQLFAQVTNPPIDPLREELVMSLMSMLGCEHNLLDETPEHARMLKLNHPVLTQQDLQQIRECRHPDIRPAEINMLFPAREDGGVLEEALAGIFAQAEEAIDKGATVLILTDKNMDVNRAAVPVLLACSGLHHHLIRCGKRTRAGIVVESGEVREVIHFAQLIGFGANAVCPHLAFATVRELAVAGLLDKPLEPEVAMDNYITAVKKGLLKTFSRMGISTVRSFFGSQIFEAVGIGRRMTEKYFTNTASRVGGIELPEVARETLWRFRRGFPEAMTAPDELLEAGGDYRVRTDGEAHLWTPQTVMNLQQAVRTNDYSVFQKYSRQINDQSQARVTLRSLLRFKPGKAVPIEEVEPVAAITRRFVTAAMSFGSISQEVHEDIAVAMNRIGGRSNSGEGGEDPRRYQPLPNGDSKISRIKQIASGRFGVTAEYLAQAEELQIKIAQGAKPGEGGQLPGHKV
ncbi:glutamate synthase subunit alpha, partial [candidate division FCPU426 bacterium]|nr:glutamate synthase subunit alpha [candidate division FCPU426 bacterium]